jgi:hypothetical protein
MLSPKFGTAHHSPMKRAARTQPWYGESEGRKRNGFAVCAYLTFLLEIDSRI